MRIALIGANGQLGADLRRALTADEVVPFVHADFDVCDAAAAGRHLSAARPDVVVNTSAYHKVDQCEDEAELSFRVNAVAVLELARWCAAHGAVFVHFSTDYVFRGDTPRPLREDDVAEPLSVYGASKLAGEWLARQACPRHYVVRSSGLYGSGGKGGANFVELMLRLGSAGKPLRVVRDQVLTPTYALDLARAVAQLVRSERFGLYHVTNSGQVSWYDFARRIFELAGVQADLAPTTAEAYGARAQRPAYSVLSNERLLAAGVASLPSWENALQRYLDERAL